MACGALFNFWKTFHAKFIKPIDRALDAFSVLMLQWLLGTYNIWDVLKICGSFFISAMQSLANIVRHRSLIWKEETSELDKSDEGASEIDYQELESWRHADPKKNGEHEAEGQESDQTTEEEAGQQPVSDHLNGDATMACTRLRTAKNFEQADSLP